MGRSGLFIVGLVAIAACSPFDVNNGRPLIPDDAIVYKFDPARLVYTFVDSSAGRHVDLRWLYIQDTLPFLGRNCIGLSPRTPTDTIGTFVFFYAGENRGYLESTALGTTDTLTAFFLPPVGFDQGSHGTFAVESSGKLNLHWADGTQSRYFDPAASIRLEGDSITSNVDSHVAADSVHTVWHVVWDRDVAC